MTSPPPLPAGGTAGFPLRVRLVTDGTIDSEQVAPFRDLTAGSMAGPRPHFVAESECVVRRLLHSRWPIQSLLLTPRRFANLRDIIPVDVDVLLAERPVLRQIVGFDMHRGCAACGLRASAPPIAWPTLLSGGRKPPVVVVAERLSDPSNLGALVRNCAAFGVTAVVADPRGANPWCRKAIRASMGHVFTVPVALEDPRAAVARLGAQLHTRCAVVAGTVSDTAIPIWRYRHRGPSILLVGNEGAGLSAELLQDCDTFVTVPMAPGADSLNAATAAAVLLYELTVRQHDGP